MGRSAEKERDFMRSSLIPCLEEHAKSSRNWTQWCDEIHKFINQRAEEGKGQIISVRRDLKEVGQDAED